MLGTRGGAITGVIYCGEAWHRTRISLDGASEQLGPTNRPSRVRRKPSLPGTSFDPS